LVETFNFNAAPLNAVLLQKLNNGKAVLVKFCTGLINQSSFCTLEPLAKPFICTPFGALVVGVAPLPKVVQAQTCAPVTLKFVKPSVNVVVHVAKSVFTKAKLVFAVVKFQVVLFAIPA
jgi:hypothetical protein